MSKARPTLRAVLVGAPNCGKSSLFNRLTGGHAYVGNRAGVTVGASAGRISAARLPRAGGAQLIDLPGIRSLTPQGGDEEISCRVLLAAAATAAPDAPTAPAAASTPPPDLIINVLCATTLERCIALTLELREALPGRPMLCVVNMCDELERGGELLQLERLEQRLGLPCVAVSAATGAGLDRLYARVDALLVQRGGRSVPAAPTSRGTRARLAAQIAAECVRPARPRSTDVTDPAAPAPRSTAPTNPAPRGTLTDRADRLLTHPVWGFAVLLVVMAAIFTLIFGPPGDRLTALLEAVLLRLPEAGVEWLCDRGLPAAAQLILRRWLLGGVGAVLSFLPKIMLLYLLLALLEDSGYLARAAYLADPLTRRFGLSGHSFISVVLAFGCSVPAIAATRTLSDRAERRRCTMLLPLIPCSARLPMYLLLSGVATGGAVTAPRYLLLLALYLLPCVVFLVLSALLRRRQGLPPFIVELPRYRLPRPGVVLRGSLYQCGDFLRRAAGTVFLSSGVVWLLSALTPTLRLTDDPELSLLAAAAGLLTPLLRPLGLRDWRLTAALLAGICAKEGAVATLGVLTPGSGALTARLAACLSPASAVSLGVFYSMYLPCAATIAAMRRESGAARTAAGCCLMLGAAYIAAAVTYFLCGRL